MDKKILGIVPARGGSKSIKKKNITRLNGKPLIYYILNTMLESNFVNRVVVSTDDEEIAKVAKHCGAETPFIRPSEFAQDSSPTMPVLYHAVEWLIKNENYTPDIIVLSQATSPFVLPSQIDDACNLLCRNPNADAVTTVIELEHNYHPFNIREIDKNGQVDFIMPEEHEDYPTRQQKPTYYAFGNCYVFRFSTLMEQKSIYGKHCIPLVIDPITAFDINEPHELIIAESMMQTRKLKEATKTMNTKINMSGKQ